MATKNKPKKGFFEKRKESINRGLGVTYLSEGARYMSSVVQRFINPGKIEQRESFEQATRRMHLTEKDLALRHKRYLQQFFIFVLGALGILAYAVYLFKDAAIGSAIVALLMMVVLFIYALRAHFWAFQIKHRKLGCTLQEWLNNKTTEEQEKQNIVKK